MSQLCNHELFLGSMTLEFQQPNNDQRLEVLEVRLLGLSTGVSPESLDNVLSTSFDHVALGLWKVKRTLRSPLLRSSSRGLRDPSLCATISSDSLT